MKTIIKHLLYLAPILLALNAKAQVQYNGCSATGTYASAIGKNNTASGNNSFAGGYNSQSIGSNSFAFGYNSKATQSTTTALGNTATASGAGSMALGNYVKATAQNSFVIGSGTSTNYPLTNNTDNSIAFGVNSNKPTLLITKSLNNNYTGKVAIGQITNPQAKLHIKSDNNEDAGVFIEPANTSTYKAFIKLFDNNHCIMVDKTAAMELNSGSGAINFKGESYGFGINNERKARLYTSGIPSLYINAARNGASETRTGEGSSFAIDFDNNAMVFRSAVYQNPRGSEISNWKKALLLCTDGKVGIGSKNTYIESVAENTLKMHAPSAIDMQSGNITFFGKVGINTTNTTNGYALAVDGGIISTKVYIKEVKQWPDYVFSSDYLLLGLEELKQYLDEKRHLPGIPSEEEILNNGYDMGEMQVLMMEKIEEMTRYILLLQDEIDQLKSKETLSGDSIVFSYDSNGNRIARNMVFQRILDPKQANPSSQTLSYDLFPNPTSGEFSIVFKEQSATKHMHATLLNVNGVILEEKDIKDRQTSFDLSGQPEGMYVLEIDSPEGHQAWKVIKR